MTRYLVWPLAVILLVIAIFALCLEPAKETESTELNLYQRHQYERWLWDLQPLNLDWGLVAVAQERANDIARTGEFTHYPSNGRDFTVIATEYGVGFNRYWWLGENLASVPASDDSYAVMVRWMNSPPHRALIHAPQFSRMGIAEARTSDGWKYIVTIFAGY